ncbi:glutathione ABC transporter permease [Limnochorda pilosa]|uniref:Glutathione ABC transporter permease n=2 Tax=Limnochorda pilosa TaxID=1555112 RepID=A0A0K2SLT9_LIMPI|nr:glutathione ABC transporter permease [Limnochorda pilosa]
MARFLIRRTLRAIIVLAVVVTAVFFVFRMAPGDPARLVAGLGASEEAVAAVRAEMGLDRPLVSQYVSYVQGLFHMDLGRSVLYGKDIAAVIAEHVPRTLGLAAAALGLALLIGLPAGIASAVWPGSVIDQVAAAGTVALLSIPNFWLGLLLISLFAVQLHWLPAGGSGSAWALVLPAVAVAARLAAVFARTARSAMLDVLGQDYIRTAVAKGIASRRVVLRHGLRNALIPVVTVVGLQLGYLLGGSVVVETLFSYSGLGFLLINAVGVRDYAVVQALTLVYVAAFLAINLLVDLAYAAIDPRIQYQ